MIIEAKDNSIFIFTRDPDGKRVVKRDDDFHNYFYIGMNENPVHDNRVMKVELSEKKTLFGEEVKKVTVRNAWDINGLRNSFYKLYESDIPIVSRYYIDMIKEIPHEKLRKFYLDIETADMPGPHLDNQPITCIGWYDNYTEAYTTLIIDTDTGSSKIVDKDKHRIYYFPTEYALLSKFVSLVQEMDPDMMIAHNGEKFDYPVIINRLKVLSVMGYGSLSPIGVVKCENAFGEWRNNIGGRILFDFLGAKSSHGTKGGIRGLLDGRDITVKDKDGEDKIVRIKRWSLKYLAQFVGMKKGDYMGVQTLDEMIEYNKLDVAIMVELDRFFNVSEYYYNMQILIGCSYQNTFFNTLMIDNFLLKRYNHFVFPTKPARNKFDNDATIEGALVDDPIQGLYKLLYVVDQTSLYPTVVVSGNLSPETVDQNGTIILGNGMRFKDGKLGIVPDAVQFLLSIRLKYKKLAKSTQDAYQAQMYDLLSNGYKTLLVSFYGALLYKGFRLYQHDVAESIPYLGRVIKAHVRKIVEDNGYQVIAGDSVVGESIVPVQDNDGNIFFTSIESLYHNTSMVDGDKEYYYPHDLKTLTVGADGVASWNKIKTVMRHNTNKTIYNVSISNKWSVDVTEDHSLIGYANVVQRKRMQLDTPFIETKPIDIGKPISSVVSMKYIPRDNINSKNYPRELYELMGLFIGDGSFEVSQNGENYSLNLSSGTDTDEIIKKVIIPLQNMGYISKYYIKSNGYDIRMMGNIISIFEDFRSSRNKIIPKWIECETEENISSFVRGIFESDGSISKRSGTYIITFTNIREDFINKIQELLWYIGIPSGICQENNSNKYKVIDSHTYTMRLNIRNNMNYKKKVGFITCRKQSLVNKIQSRCGKINISNMDFDIVNHLNVKEIQYNGYVYDLEVENVHTFFANGILVHNTDSSFLNPIRPDATSIDALVELINKSFDKFALDRGMKKHIFNIELDKIYSPIIMSDVKKRYVGYLIKNGKPIYKVTGWESVRRDTAPVTEYFQETVFKMILGGKSQKEVEAFVKDLMAKCISGAIPLSSLMLPKGFSKTFGEYKNENIWMRGVQYSNKYLGTHFDHFSEVGAFHIKACPEGKAFTDVICVDDETFKILDGFLIDWKTQLDKTIWSKYENIKEMMGWIDAHQKTLGAYSEQPE